jgi:hypothetical protein
VEEGVSSTELLEYSHMADNSPVRQVYMASLRNADDDELGPEYDDELLADVSADEPTADAPQDVNEDLAVEECQARRAHMEHEKSCSQPNVPKEPQQCFCSSADREYRTPVSAIAEAALLAQQLPPNPQIQRLQYLTQRTLVQLDGQHLVSSTRNLPSRSERQGDTAQISLLSVKTHWRAATGNMRSREALGTAGGPRSLGQRPRIRHTTWHLGCKACHLILYLIREE